MTAEAHPMILEPFLTGQDTIPPRPKFFGFIGRSGTFLVGHDDDDVGAILHGDLFLMSVSWLLAGHLGASNGGLDVGGCPRHQLDLNFVQISRKGEGAEVAAGNSGAMIEANAGSD